MLSYRMADYDDDVGSIDRAYCEWRHTSEAEELRLKFGYSEVYGVPMDYFKAYILPRLKREARARKEEAIRRRREEESRREAERLERENRELRRQLAERQAKQAEAERIARAKRENENLRRMLGMDPHD